MPREMGWRLTAFNSSEIWFVMINWFQTVDDLVSALGGAKQVAQIAGVGVTAVCNWRRSNRIPPHLYLSFKQACDDRDVQVPDKLFARAAGPDRFPPTTRAAE